MAFFRKRRRETGQGAGSAQERAGSGAFTRNGAQPVAGKETAAASSVGAGPAAAETRDTPLIERAREMTRLKQAWQSATQGKGRVVLLAAEAGYGKSALARAFLAQVAASGAPHKIASAACSAQSGRDEPFWPFADVMSQIVANKTRQTSEQVIDALLEIAPGWVSVIPVAGPVVGASIKTAQVVRGRTRGSEMPAPDKLMREYAAALQKEAARQPVCIFIDDMHWSDAASARLLSHLSRNIGHMRALIVVAYRPSDITVEGHPLRDLVSEMLRYDADAQIAVPPLSREGLQALVNALYPANRFPASLLTALHESSGGSPMFAIESLRLMESRGELVRDATDGRWRVTQARLDEGLPRNVEAVIHKRLERLPAELLEALSLAATQGVTFDTAVLAHVMARPEVDVMKLIEPAERIHNIIAYQGDLELDNDLTARYRFTSALFQREMHNNLRGKQKMIAHRKTAEGLEALWGERAISLAPQLARHYELGRVWDKAARYTLAAARQARMAGAVTQAIALYENAERLFERGGQIGIAEQFEIDEGLSFLYELDSDYAQAEARAQRALRIGNEALGWRRYAMLHIRLAVLAENAGRFKRAESLLNTVYDRICNPKDIEADALSPEAFEVRAHLTRMMARVSRAREAVAFAEQALAMIEQAPQSEALQLARLRLLNNLAFACAAGGDYPRALAIYEEILAPARATGLMDMQARLLSSLANLRLTLGNYDEARKIIHEMIDIAADISSESLLATAHLLAGRSLLQQSKPFAALRHLDQAAEVAGRLKFFYARAELLALRALALIRLDRVDDAQPLLDEAAIVAERSGSREWAAYVRLIRAEAWLARGNAESALTLAQNAASVFHEEGARFDEAASWRTAGRACHMMGRLDDAARMYRRARDLFAAIGNDKQVARTQQEAGDLLRQPA